METLAEVMIAKKGINISTRLKKRQMWEAAGDLANFRRRHDLGFLQSSERANRLDSAENSRESPLLSDLSIVEIATRYEN
jgi:hypothetical protein